ncbi:hypothetical protein Bpfe_014028 [Biomphalaria pfeifferi]|uniref:Uncharacterized protein n=1 Tax=Biomphalaria pfeifferi TaxID=112525 RepID=A0AAD8BKW5_BIOPF|nr:hypothetical protein Bpfe_014028 [Biomphalaria pfeifferi]
MVINRIFDTGLQYGYQQNIRHWSTIWLSTEYSTLVYNMVINRVFDTGLQYGYQQNIRHWSTIWLSTEYSTLVYNMVINRIFDTGLQYGYQQKTRQKLTRKKYCIYKGDHTKIHQYR